MSSRSGSIVIDSDPSSVSQVPGLNSGVAVDIPVICVSRATYDLFKGDSDEMKKSG